MTDNTALREISELTAPTYQNTTSVLTLAGVPFTMWDVCKTALAARLNVGLGGGAGSGKSQLLNDLQGLYGNNATKVLGRNDLDVKTLFRQLKFEKLSEALKNGGTVSQRDLAQITAEIHKPFFRVEEITRCVEAVQNQLFNVFEGYVELDGVDYPLGGGTLETFKDIDGTEWKRNVLYSVGVWSTNFGNGQYTGTSTMDKAMKERTHLIIDADNFYPRPKDLDGILLGSAGEVRLKSEEKPEDRTATFQKAFAYLKQKSMTPDPEEFGQELLLFRYLVWGLDYIPSPAADNSKRKMKEVWPSKAEEEDLGTSDEDKVLYRMVFPASVRGALSIMTFARALREYAAAVDPSADPTVMDSVVESIRLVGAYSGMIENPQRVREKYVGNLYKASSHVADILKTRLQAKRDVMEAIIYKNAAGEALDTRIMNECQNEFACFVER